MGTYDGSALRLYVNGLLVDNARLLPTRRSASAQPLRIGGGGSNNFFWKGGMDEVAVYAVAPLSIDAGEESLCTRRQFVPVNVDLMQGADPTPVLSIAAGDPERWRAHLDRCRF